MHISIFTCMCAWHLLIQTQSAMPTMYNQHWFRSSARKSYWEDLLGHTQYQAQSGERCQTGNEAYWQGKNRCVTSGALFSNGRWGIHVGGQRSHQGSKKENLSAMASSQPWMCCGTSGTWEGEWLVRPSLTHLSTSLWRLSWDSLMTHEAFCRIYLQTINPYKPGLELASL